MELLDLRKVSNSYELEPSLLIMCIGAPESTTNSRSSGLLEAVGVDLPLTSPRT